MAAIKSFRGIIYNQEKINVAFYPKPLSGLVMRDLKDGIYSP